VFDAGDEAGGDDNSAISSVGGADFAPVAMATHVAALTRCCRQRDRNRAAT
jgi:hypothetical protein